MADAWTPSPIGQATPTTLPVAPPSRPIPPTPGVYHPSEIHTALVAAGVPPSVAPVLTAITGAESRYGASPISGVNRDGSRDYGVGQINSKAWPQFGGPAVAKLPLADQAKIIAHVYNKQGLTAWSTYNNGAYKRYMSDAEKAAASGPVPIPTGAPPAGAPPTVKQNFAQAAQAGDVGAAVAALNAPGESGKSPMDNLSSMMAGGGQQQRQQQQPAAPDQSGMVAPNPSLMHNATIAAQGQQQLAQAIADYTKPLTWGPGTPGTTLNTTGA